MATDTDKTEFDPKTLGDYEHSLWKDYSRDKDVHDDSVTDFDAFEAMHQGKTYDSVSRETTNGITDNMTSTIYLERAARVAGQLPEGEVQAFGKRDKGKGLFMDILRQKWIYPNANAQLPFKTKMFLLQYGSSEYGYSIIHYDLNMTPSGYFGPDCWIWNPRMFIPQDGFNNINEMDYVHGLALKSYSFFDDILDEESENKVLNKKSGWKFDTIREIKDSLKDDSTTPDDAQQTLEQKQRTGNPKQVLIATRYESGPKGRWISFLPAHGYRVIRSIKNPHKNGKIPFVKKMCIPSTDSFYTVGDFARSMPMQFANDGLTNFYFQGIKMNLFPPTVANAQTIIRHTMSQEPGAIWEVNGNVNDIKRLDTSTAGLSTYQNAKGEVKGAIQSIAGTTDTRANKESSSDPGFGKTPEALKMMQMREGTRDNFDREFLEEAMKELIDGMLSLVPTIASKIPVDMFASEIADIYRAGHDDIKELFKDAKKDGFVNVRKSDSGEQARLTIDPTKFQGLEYRFELVGNSTAKKTKEGQLAALLDFLNFMGKMPNALDQYREVTGKVPAWDKIFTKYGLLADIDGMDDLFTDAPEVEEEETAGGAPAGGTDVAAIAQAAAMQPEQIAQGGMQPPMQQPPLAQPQPQMQAPMQAPQGPQLLSPEMVLGEQPAPVAGPTPLPANINPAILASLQEYQAMRGQA